MQIDIINTGGTFNKRYNPLNGQLEIDTSNESIMKILNNTYGNIEFTLQTIINKDSLDFDDNDRQTLLETIKACENDIIVIHGTDTMKQSCIYLDDNLKDFDKNIVFTGSMYPYYVQGSEPTFNLATSIAALKFLHKKGIYIAMHGVVDNYKNVEKDYQEGRFYRINK